MPETGDSDFTWSGFVRRNNDELVATYGNLVHRVLTFTYRNFDRKVPAPRPLDFQSQQLLDRASETLDSVGRSLDACKFRAGMTQAMALAQEVNRYLDSKAPWKSLKVDREATATALWVSLSVINCLKVVMYPFLPFSAQKLHHMLGFQGELQGSGWDWKGDTGHLPPGQLLNEPTPLYTKLDAAVVEQESLRLGAGAL